MEDERFSNVTLVVKLFCFGFPLLSKLGGKHKHWERLFFFYIFIYLSLKKLVLSSGIPTKPTKNILKTDFEF